MAENQIRRIKKRTKKFKKTNLTVIQTSPPVFVDEDPLQHQKILMI